MQSKWTLELLFKIQDQHQDELNKIMMNPGFQGISVRVDENDVPIFEVSFDSSVRPKVVPPKIGEYEVHIIYPGVARLASEPHPDDESYGYNKPAKDVVNPFVGENKAQKLLEFCEKFIIEKKISCAEAVYQTDRVSESSLEFIEGVVELVGLYDWDEEKIVPFEE